MTNEELLSYLIVSGKMDLKVYDDRKFDKSIFKLLINNEDIWSVSNTLEYANKICKDYRIRSIQRMLSLCTMKELCGHIMFTKSLYNTLIFDIEGWCNKFKKDKVGSLYGMLYFRKHLITKIKSLEINDEDIKDIEMDISAFWRQFAVNILENKIDHGTADGKGFYALKFNSEDTISLKYYHMNNINDYKGFKERDYFVIF